MPTKKLLTLALLSAGIAGHALAQDAHMHGGSTASQGGPVAEAFQAANAKMHTDMAIKYSGDADVDFVRSMIPHHQGAIDMAKVQLEHGDDPQMRKVAEEVIKAQEAEIAEMRQWLEEHGHN